MAERIGIDHPAARFELGSTRRSRGLPDHNPQRIYAGIEAAIGRVGEGPFRQDIDKGVALVVIGGARVVEAALHRVDSLPYHRSTKTYRDVRAVVGRVGERSLRWDIASGVLLGVIGGARILEATLHATEAMIIGNKQSRRRGLN